MTASHELIRLAGFVALVAMMATPASAMSRADTTAARNAGDPSCTTPYSAPFAVGEQLKYSVKFGMLKAGEGMVEVVRKDTVRGREAYHTRFRVKGGIPMYRVDDVLESWFAVDC